MSVRSRSNLSATSTAGANALPRRGAKADSYRASSESGHRPNKEELFEVAGEYNRMA